MCVSRGEGSGEDAHGTLLQKGTLWRSVADERPPVVTEANSFLTMLCNLAPYADYSHAIASEGQGADSSTSRDGAAGSRDGHDDQPTTMGQQFADAVLQRFFVLKQCRMPSLS
jgi:hypothetical protein